MTPTTVDPSLKLTAVAEALAIVAGRADTVIASHGYDPVGQEIPSGTFAVGDVVLTRTALLEPEGLIGRDDWLMAWTMTAYVSLQDPGVAYPWVRTMVGSATYHIDRDHTLGGEVREARMVEATTRVSEPEELPTRMLMAECRVEAHAFMPRTEP